MHELSIAQSVVDIACRHARGRQVTRVELKIGHLRQVVPSALSFSFALVAQGTVLEGAELEIHAVPAVGRCRRCRTESVLETFPLSCAGCGGFDLQIVAGEELVVEALDIEEVPLGANCD